MSVVFGMLEVQAPGKAVFQGSVCKKLRFVHKLFPAGSFGPDGHALGACVSKQLSILYLRCCQIVGPISGMDIGTCIGAM